ncbi:MAG: hypothetical protein U0167_07550 [bacterium]
MRPYDDAIQGEGAAYYARSAACSRDLEHRARSGPREHGRCARRLADARASQPGPAAEIRDETAAMAPVVIARTVSRSVLGSMIDFGYSLPYYLAAAGWDEPALREAEDRLAETRCRAKGRGAFFPDQRVPGLLAARRSPRRGARRPS